MLLCIFFQSVRDNIFITRYVFTTMDKLFLVVLIVNPRQLQFAESIWILKYHDIILDLIPVISSGLFIESWF